MHHQNKTATIQKTLKWPPQSSSSSKYSVSTSNFIFISIGSLYNHRTQDRAIPRASSSWKQHLTKWYRILKTRTSSGAQPLSWSTLIRAEPPRTLLHSNSNIVSLDSTRLLATTILLSPIETWSVMTINQMSRIYHLQGSRIRTNRQSIRHVGSTNKDRSIGSWFRINNLAHKYHRVTQVRFTN